jgi:hypothetical protein
MGRQSKATYINSSHGNGRPVNRDILSLWNNTPLLSFFAAFEFIFLITASELTILCAIDHFVAFRDFV